MQQRKPFSETKEQLDLSNLFEKVLHHRISKAEDKKKKLVPEVVEKQLPNKEPFTSRTKREYETQQKKL